MNRGASRNVIVSIELLAFDNLIRNIHFFIWNIYVVCSNFYGILEINISWLVIRKKLLHHANVCHDEILFQKMIFISKIKCHFTIRKGFVIKKNWTLEIVQSMHNQHLLIHKLIGQQRLTSFFIMTITYLSCIYWNLSSVSDWCVCLKAVILDQKRNKCIVQHWTITDNWWSWNGSITRPFE